MSFKDLDLFIIAAETSADRHGVEIVKNLLDVQPNLKIAGVLGPNLRSLNIPCIFPMEKLQVMGFIDVLFALPKILYRFFLLKKNILKLNPKAVLFIDYPEFNLRLERSIKKAKFKGKIFHHVSPTVWAWAKKRISIMEKGIDELFCIFPFEKAFFKTSSFNVSYVGHPLFESIQNYRYDLDFRKNYEIPKTNTLLSIFPGSRTKEIYRNLPIQLETALKLQQEDKSLTIALSVSNEQTKKVIDEVLKNQKINITLVPQKDAYNLMKATDLAIATSGTVSLELAFHEVPSVITFGVQLIDLIIAQKILKIDLPFFCIVNIITQKPTFPELFGPNLTLNKLFYWTKRLVTDSKYKEEIIKSCIHIKSLFENKSPKKEISKKLLSFLEKNS